MIIPNLQIKLLLTFPPLLTSPFDSFSSFVSNSTLLSSFLQMVLISLRSCSAKFNQLLYFQSHQLRLSHPISKERLPLRDYCFVWVRSIMFNWLDGKNTIHLSYRWITFQYFTYNEINTFLDIWNVTRVILHGTMNKKCS